MNQKDFPEFTINELFDFYDGNDDILSDIGNVSNEVRRGMWAQMPYSVSDGTGVINENSISLDRSMADRIANKIVQLNQFKHMQYAGEGAHGFAYYVGNDIIMKVTSDKSEAIESLKVKGKKLEHLADIYNVYQVTPKSGSDIVESYVIIMERLKINESYFDRMVERIDYAFDNILGIDPTDIIDDYVYGEYDDKKEVIDRYMSKNPEDAKFYYGLLNIADEARKYGIESMDYVNTSNLGYKKNGSLGFFDMGFGDLESAPFQHPEKVEMEEDGTAKFSTDSAMGQEEFPPYNTNNTSPSIQNDLNANSKLYNEDLEYHHVDDATKDKYELDERIKTFVPGSKSVTVKKKCRIGGLGSTSCACNQGDIRNLELKSIDEDSDIVSESMEIDSLTDNNNLKIIKSVLNGKRNIGFVELNKNNIKSIEKNNIGVIPVRMKPNNTLMCIIYNKNDKDNAFRLYNIVKKNGGYLTDKSPEEAKEIGLLLGFNDAIIDEYIRRKYENKNLKEEIDANEATTDEGAFQALLAGRKDVAFLHLKYDPKFKKKVINSGFGLMKIDQKDHPNLEAYLVYRDKNKAEKLFQILQKHDGYFDDQTPEEAYEIGKLLDYTDDSINKFIQRNYNKTLTEQTIKDFEKLIEKDVKYHKLDKFYLFEEDDFKVYAVNGDRVRDSGFIEWVDGGHHYVDADDSPKDQKYAKHIPEDEIWVDDVFIIKPNDLAAILLHEKLERHLMKFYGLKYENAHSNYANPAELKFRKTVKDGFGIEESEKIYNEYVKKFKNRKEVKVDIEKEKKETTKPINESIDEVKKNDINETETMSLQDLSFRQEIEQRGGKTYSIGGKVRDELLGKESKDLDILITGIPMEELEQILSKYGRVNAVGKSFGILKFKPRGAMEDIDIAIPRSDKKTGEGGHKGFNVTSDYTLPIEKDLFRRDFTINAMAKDAEGNIIDPFGGQEDLKNKIIRVVNPEAFSDDPLRLLRAINFASRFDFTIEPETMKMIQDNAGKIKEISPERILIEFDKIINKGNKRIGVQLLKNTGLFNQIFGFNIQQSQIDRSPFEEVKTMGEFIFLLTKLLPNPAGFYKNNLRGDINTYKEIKALQMAFDSSEATNLIEARSVAHNMYITSPQSLESQILPNIIKTAAQELIQNKYPKTINELAINGNDLMNLGLKDKEIGDMQKLLLLKIYANKVRNDREDLLNLLNQNKNNLNESESKYSDTKKSLMMSKSIDKEMKEEILKYLGGGSTYHEGGRVHGLIMPKELIDKTSKSKGVSLGADKDGFFVYTHRQRSKSYESPEKISIKDIEFTESTG